MINRRKFIEVCATAMMLPTLARSQTTKKNRWTSTELTSLNQSLAKLERTSGGRLGVSVLDTASGQIASYRGDERFMMLSTFKTLAASYVLARADRGDDKLNRRMQITQADILEHAPVTQRHLGPKGMTLADLCQAAVTASDNTAANLLHRSYGGPEALTQFIRSLGDQVTRHDRYEPELNNPHPSEPMDTTSPNAMSRALNTLVFGTTLRPESRHLLQSWLKGCITGDNRLRAGIPSNWGGAEKKRARPGSAQMMRALSSRPEGRPSWRQSI